jgi:hypothetical protein
LLHKENQNEDFNKNTDSGHCYQYAFFYGLAESMIGKLGKNPKFGALKSRLVKLKNLWTTKDQCKFVQTYFEIVTWKFLLDIGQRPVFRSDTQGFPDIECENFYVECVSPTSGIGENKKRTDKFNLSISLKDFLSKDYCPETHNQMDETMRYVPRVLQSLLEKIDKADKFVNSTKSEKPIVIAIDTSFINAHPVQAIDTLRLALYGETEDTIRVCLNKDGELISAGLVATKHESGEIPETNGKGVQKLGIFISPVFKELNKKEHRVTTVWGCLLFPSYLFFSPNEKPSSKFVCFFGNEKACFQGDKKWFGDHVNFF